MMRLGPLYDYQAKVDAFAAGRSRVGLFVPYGGGKTYNAFQWLHTLDKPFPCLILCQKSAREQLGTELEKFTDLSYRVVMGTKEQRAEALAPGADVYILNYDAWRSKYVYPVMLKGEWRTLIADESTMLKEQRTQRFAALHKLAKATLQRALLSGRPTTEAPEELYSQMLFLNDGETFGRSFWRYRYTYFKEPPPWAPYKWKLKIGAARQIANRMNKYCIRIPEEVVEAELPPKHFIPVHFKMEPRTQRIYSEFKEEFRVELPSGRMLDTKWALEKETKLHEICNGFTYPNEILEVQKIEWIGENVPLMLSRGPIIIWSHWRIVLKIISERLAGIPHAVFHGETPNQGEILKRFNAGEIDVLIVSIAAGYSSLNLQRANNVIIHDNSRSAEQRHNMIKRTHRTGTKNQVNYYDLIMKASIDTAIVRAFKDKTSVGDSIMKHIREE